MFRDQLQDLVNNTPGALAGVLMGFDGIGVEQYVSSKESMDVTTVTMEFSFLFSQIRKMAGDLRLGDLQDIQITTDRYQLLLRCLSKDYFVALLLEANALAGKGRYRLRLQGAKIQEEL